MIVAPRHLVIPPAKSQSSRHMSVLDKDESGIKMLSGGRRIEVSMSSWIGTETIPLTELTLDTIKSFIPIAEQTFDAIFGDAIDPVDKIVLPNQDLAVYREIIAWIEYCIEKGRIVGFNSNRIGHYMEKKCMLNLARDLGMGHLIAEFSDYSDAVITPSLASLSLEEEFVSSSTRIKKQRPGKAEYSGFDFEADTRIICLADQIEVYGLQKGVDFAKREPERRQKKSWI